MAREFIYHMHGMTKVHGSRKIVENVNLSFYPDAKIGIIGVNGAGKSTILRIMAGQDTGFTGEARLANGATVGYLPQEPQLDEDLDVLGNVMLGVARQQAKLDRYNEIAMNYSDKTADEMARLQDEIDAENLWDLDGRVEMAMDALRCPPGDADSKVLSGGEKRRVALCKLLLERPDLLLLDEPTNHLDAETVAWLEKYLREYDGAILLVTHDRYFLDNVTSWILELDRGRGIPWKGNYSSWLEQKQKRLENESRSEESRQRTLSRELEWVRSSPKARQAKSRARINAYEDLLNRAGNVQAGRVQIIIPVAERLGNRVVEIEHLNKGFGDQLLIEDLNFSLPPGGIVGVIGPNGAGKTTLFKMLMRQEEPDSGTIEIGETVHIGAVDQTRDHLAGDKTIWEEISGGTNVVELGNTEMNSRAYVSAFNFRGADQQRKWASFPAVNATGFTWQNCSRAGTTCCCLTSRPTIWTWKPFRPWKSRWKTMPAAP